MTITLNHTIVPAVDNETEARFLAAILGLSYDGPNRHFAPVRINEQLTLDFMTVDEPHPLHLAFDVDPATFDAALAHLRSAAIPHGNRPHSPDNGLTDHPFAARGVFFRDAAENLYELMSPE
jgi:catechol 2,3-dioxygenase-like lactoylglutathione lyase family enzyme